MQARLKLSASISFVSSEKPDLKPADQNKKSTDAKKTFFSFFRQL
jgi:hypothetical protein